jgi:importin subunit beta-1
MAIEGDFLPYLVGILGILQQAADVRIDDSADEDLVEYINVLRESILEAYAGILQV